MHGRRQWQVRDYFWDYAAKIYARDFLGLKVVVTDLNQNHNGDGGVYINLFESTKSTSKPSV